MYRIFDESVERRLFAWAALHSKREQTFRATMCGIAGAVVSAMELVSGCVATPILGLFDYVIKRKKPMSREEKDELIKKLLA